MNPFWIAGILLNAILIVTNRFICRLPNWLQIPLLLIGIALMIAGFITL